jgi:hypothetical protein
MQNLCQSFAPDRTFSGRPFFGTDVFMMSWIDNFGVKNHYLKQEKLWKSKVILMIIKKMAGPVPLKLP